MRTAATLFATAVVAVGGGVLGAVGYDQFRDDDAVVQQAPLTSSSQPATSDDSTVGLTASQIYKKTSPGVVLIQAAVTQETDSPFGQQEQQGTSTGTGFVVDKDGFIVTNAHVVEGAKAATVQFGEDKKIDAKIMGLDVNSDLAVLKVDPSEHDLVPLTLGSTKGLTVGDPVVAIGNPFGLDRTLTTGVVSALARKISGLNGFAITNVVQTDAAINKGNSGGPLIDSKGEVIGVNSQIQTESGGNVGIGFAVPVERLEAVLPTLEKGEEVKVAFLGVSTIPVDRDLARLGIKADNGLLVAAVTPGSGAEKAGIRAGDSRASVTIDGTEVNLGGDIILTVDGREFASAGKLAEYVSGKKVGDKLTIKLLRDAKEKTMTVELGNRPTTATTN
jgi:S1-C subfamily serine protease